MEDPSGNLWVLLSTDTIDGAQRQRRRHRPVHDSQLQPDWRRPYRERARPDHVQRGRRRHLVLRIEQQLVRACSIPPPVPITEYPALFFSADPRIVQIVAGSDGNIWFTEPDLNEIGMFDVSTDLISQFTMPLPDTQPQGITVGSDGNLWFTEGGLNQLGSINPYTHVLNQLSLRTVQLYQQ